MKELDKVSTPDAHTIELVAECLNLPLDKTIKAVAFQDDKDELILAFVRGDHDVNDVKVVNIIEGNNININ